MTKSPLTNTAEWHLAFPNAMIHGNPFAASLGRADLSLTDGKVALVEPGAARLTRHSSSNGACRELGSHRIRMQSDGRWANTGALPHSSRILPHLIVCVEKINFSFRLEFTTPYFSTSVCFAAQVLLRPTVGKNRPSCAHVSTPVDASIPKPFVEQLCY